jgi:anionic cell wall polymer biosynthesis LytR-Cps2A-Psr (LCP) family protein
MKKILGLVFIIAFAVASCGGGGSPSKLVKDLHKAIDDKNTEKINEIMTEDAAPLMIMYVEKAKGTIENQGKIVKTEEKIDGDKATVKVTYEDGSTGDFDLIKVDGKWKVTMSK